MTTEQTVSLVAATVAATAAWFLENTAIHAAGYSGFAGAGWITAVIIPLGAAAWAWDKAGAVVRRRGI